jgi:hypothetical protein
MNPQQLEILRLLGYEKTEKQGIVLENKSFQGKDRFVFPEDTSKCFRTTQQQICRCFAQKNCF